VDENIELYYMIMKVQMKGFSDFQKPHIIVVNGLMLVAKIEML